MKEVVIKYLRDIYYVWENLNYKNSCYCPVLWTSYKYKTNNNNNNNMHYIYFYIKCIIIIFFQSLR